MVKVCAVPGQLAPPFVKVGVTVIVAVTGDVPALVAVKEAMLPVPLAARPIDIVLLVQSYVVAPPVLLVPKVTAIVGLLLQTTWSAGSFTWADGLTVIVKVCAVPEQLTPPFVKVGVTVMVAVTGDVPVLIALNDAIFPVPFAARPIVVLLFVHAYVVVPPVLFVEKVTAVVGLPLHTTWSAGSVTWADGLTVMVKV